MMVLQINQVVVYVSSKRIRSNGLFVLVSSLLIIILVSSSLKVSEAQTPQELASTYAPVLHFTSGEKFYPTSVNYIINSSALKHRDSDGSPTLVESNPTVFTLGSYAGTDLFLDNELSTLDAIATDYASKASSLGYYAYVHIVTTSTYTVIQYWFVYAYNNGPLNDHQGDIEVVQVFLDSTGTPVKALYSQHGAGENAGWGDVEMSDTHPVIYVAQGSHANYFRSYQGKIGVENDIVGADGKTILPTELTLVMLGEQNNHLPEQSWLDFQGRWGFWGTDEDVALGRAGPLGPVFNQDGERWGLPESYLDSTFGVYGNYFTLAWIVANIMLLFAIYVIARAGWKIWGIVKLHRKGGLLVGKFLKGRGGIGLVLTVLAILITVAGLFLPWYVISGSSQTGPLAQEPGGVTLLTIDGITGMQVNMFMGTGGDSTSGYSSLFSMQFPFALFIAVGVILLTLDVIGVKNVKSLGLKLIVGAIQSLLPFILILIFIIQLPAFLPYASQLVPGQGIPPGLETMVGTIAGNPIMGTTSQQFQVIGLTTVNWGFGIGAYLFVVAAVIRIVAAYIIRTTPELQEKPVQSPPPTKTERTEPPPAPQ
jgi:hypothetical protein